MKVAIVGSRDFKDAYIRVQKLVNRLSQMYGEGLIVVSGGSGKVDLAALNVCIDLGIPVMTYPANWRKYGSAAGPKRNMKIVKMADIVYAFWDAKSRGTANTIRIAQELDKKVVIRRPT